VSRPPRDPLLAIAAVIRDPAGRYLVIRRAPGITAPGYWQPVTGRPERGEALEAAVVREVKEEVGMDVRVVREAWRCRTEDQRFLLVWYDTACVGEACLVLKADEVAEARWVTPEEALGLSPMFPGTRKFFEERL
jgi:8-oxo-dGTP diphosphatase